MRLIILFVSLHFSLALFSQGEETAPMSTNPYIQKTDHKPQKTNNKSNSGTFDSTFIYVPDTLQLPFFDEFSKDKFQKYTANFSDPGVTFDKKYHLLDGVTSDPLPADTLHSYFSQPTFRRIYSIDHLSFTDSLFAAIPVKIGSLVSYPVNYVTTNVYPAYYIYDSLGVPNDHPDTIRIESPDIIQDSATQFFTTLNDPNSLWLDSYAYHNYRYAINPWSIGVATFDGLNEYGKAYNLGGTTPSYADYLTSKPIDMSGNMASDSVYFSFLYQPGGFGDQPEPSDSLVLEFYSVDLDEWIRVWSDSGFVSSNFKVGHICITNSQYFKKGFQFRFKNFGNLSGGFDHWNLDYVHLRALSGYQDTLFKDYTWVYPIATMLKDYTSVPWDHYKDQFTGKMSNNVNLVIRNGSNIPENNSTPGDVTIKYNGALEGSFPVTGVSLSNGDLNYAPRTTYSTLHDFSTGYHYDETKPGTKATFDIIAAAQAQFPNFNQNDTTFSTQTFRNYYSYDDGTAEVAYGTTGAQSRLAIKFTPYESDSLIGIMTNFVESGVSVANKLFLLTVWADNGGVPGTILYKDSIFFPRTPMYENTINEFYTYYFNENKKVKVNGTFYIGWQQFSTDRLNIGFDNNLVNNDKNFYSLDGFSWVGSSVPGTIMMRPVFSTAMDAELGVENKTIQPLEFNIFPNPTTGLIQIKHNFNEYKGVEIYNLQGSLVLSSFDLNIDLSSQSPGIYFLKSNNQDNAVYKVIKY